MPFEATLEPGERVQYEERLELGGPSEQVAFAITTHSLFVPARKRFALWDPHYYKRLALSDVRAVSLARHRSAWLWASSTFVLLCGALLFYESLTSRPPRLDFAALHTVIMSVSMLALALGRRSVLIRTVHETYAWNPPTRLGRQARSQLDSFHQRLLAALRSAGVRVISERNR